MLSQITNKQSVLDTSSTKHTDVAQSMTTSSVTYEEVPSGREDVRRFAAVQITTPSSSKEPLSIHAWMALVASNSNKGIEAASKLSDIIAASSYESILFETPGASLETSKTTQFEVAMVNEPALKSFAEGRPDRYAFEEHFNRCREEENNDTVCSFQNLGGDASLVSPSPQSGVKDSYYSHLATFVRSAPSNQVSEFWTTAAKEYLHNLQQRGQTKTWFSTNGLGVAWLHLRLDSYPKYYSYAPFKG